MQIKRADLSNARWRKSTYSHGQDDCLEIADNIPVRDWRKSAYSDTGAECVEVADNMPGWHKSTYSTGQEECLEVTDTPPGEAAIAVRDSKRPSGPALFLPHEAWANFIRTL